MSKNDLPNDQTIPTRAQPIIREVMRRLRAHSKERADCTQSCLDFAVESLVKACGAERGLIWLTRDALTVAARYNIMDDAGFTFSTSDCASVSIEYLCKFKLDSEGECVQIQDVEQDPDLQKLETLSAFHRNTNTKSILLAQLRCTGILWGFIELQCGAQKVWDDESRRTLECVAEMLSIVLQSDFSHTAAELQAKTVKNLSELSVACLDLDVSTGKLLRKAAESLGFVNCQAYLEKDGKLVPQTEPAVGEPLSISDSGNPFVSVYDTGRIRVFLPHLTHKPDSFFHDDDAIIVPLTFKGTRIGVVGFWKLETPAEIGTDRLIWQGIAAQISSFAQLNRDEAAVR